MEDRNDRKSKDLNIILAALDTDKQQLADEIGEDRTVVSKVLSGKRKSPSTRKKLARALCAKVEDLIIPSELTEQATAEV
jgi:transcriptional regulator with XRE-family HTH domain